MRLLIPVLGFVLSCVALSGCSLGAPGGSGGLDGSPGIERARVETLDYAFKLASTRLPAGLVQFDVQNTGRQPHEVMLVPVEDGRYGLPLVHVELRQTGDVQSVSASLAPGSYVLVCFLQVETASGVVSHVDLGMATPIEVEG